MSGLREFVFPCVDVAGVMVPEHRYAELEEVVRCRDCKHCERHRDGWSVCRRWNEPLVFADGDGFCAWGERRES